MRILSGKLKGSKLLTNELKIKSSKNFITRPTSARVKETLFNIIQHAFNIDFNQISFLDCFSGSGAIGLEAISRGSSAVSFLDNDRFSCRCIIKNLNNLQLYENNDGRSFSVINKDFFDKSLIFNNTFDVVFMDPPYDLVTFREVFMRLSELRVTNKDSLIIYESNRELEGIEIFETLKSKKIGKTYLTFFKMFN